MRAVKPEATAEATSTTARVPRSRRRAQYETQVYGWSSLEAILRAEGSFGESPDELFAAIFTLGAVGSRETTPCCRG